MACDIWQPKNHVYQFSGGVSRIRKDTFKIFDGITEVMSLFPNPKSWTVCMTRETFTVLVSIINLCNINMYI